MTSKTRANAEFFAIFLGNIEQYVEMKTHLWIIIVIVQMLLAMFYHLGTSHTLKKLFLKFIFIMNIMTSFLVMIIELLRFLN